MRACCTYCSIEVSASSERIPAVQRWGIVRVRNAEHFAQENNMPLLLLSAEHDLVDKDDCLPPGGADLSDKDIGRKSFAIARQLEEKGVRELKFLVNPSNRLAIAYLRLITLACDRAEVSLEVLDHRGRPFAEWSKVFRQAEEAKRHASKPGVSIEHAFVGLFRRYGEEDGMIWFRRGETYRERQQYSQALADFEQAAQLFTMKEWRDAANAQAKSAGTHIPLGRSLNASTQDELKEIDRLASDAVVKRLGSEALRVAGESPSASILLCYAAMERIGKIANRLPLDPRTKIPGQLKDIRDRIAHGSLIGERGQANTFENALFDMLKFHHGLRWSRRGEPIKPAQRSHIR